LNNLLKTYESGGNQTVYIATNEKNASVLAYLKSNNFKFYKDLWNGTLPHTINSTLDAFITELSLMCDSKYFFSMGSSTINKFVIKHCRTADQITIHDGLNGVHTEAQDSSVQSHEASNNSSIVTIDIPDDANTPFHPSKNISDHFYYIQVDGEIQQMLWRLHSVWRAAVATNRTVHVVRYHSEYYNASVNLCNLFLLPPSIVCVSILSMEVSTCSYADSSRKDVFTWKNRTMISSVNVDFSSIDCIAGQINSETGRYPLIVNEPKCFVNGLIVGRYNRWIPPLYAFIGIKNADFVTLYWRRNDRLTFGCQEAVSGHCDEETFHRILTASMRKHLPSAYDSFKVVIVTNDRELKVLLHWKSPNYVVIQDARNPLDYPDIEMDMIELIAMCNAKYFISWNRDEGHRFIINQCRDDTTPAIFI